LKAAQHTQRQSLKLTAKRGRNIMAKAKKKASDPEQSIMDKAQDKKMSAPWMKKGKKKVK
jgi:hypothetical protein